MDVIQGTEMSKQDNRSFYQVQITMVDLGKKRFLFFVNVGTKILQTGIYHQGNYSGIRA